MARGSVNKPSVPLPAGTVEMRQSGQRIWISPPVEHLADYFYTACHQRTHDAEHGAAILALRENLVTEVTRRGRPMLACLAGLKPLILELLNRHGLHVKEKGSQPAPLLAPAWDRLVAFQRVDHALLAFVRQFERGLISYEPLGKVQVVKLLAQITLAWPTTPMAVLVTRIQDARRLARRLGKYVPDVGLVTGRDRKDQPHCRVVVVTPRYLGRGDVAVEKRKLCVAVNPAEIFGAAVGDGSDVIKALKQARLYGLKTTDTELPPRLRDLLTALFGMNEVLIPRHGYQPVRVRVVFSPIRGGARPPMHKDQALIKHLGVHEHHLRNRRICNLASSLAYGCRDLIKKDYPEVAACLGDTIGRVGVLVDNVRHGLALAGKLGWPLVVGPLCNDEGLSREDRELIDNGRDVDLRTRLPVVVTSEGMKHAGFFDVLIRADGGVDVPQIPLVKLSAPDHERPKMLLVDFRDEHHPLLRRWSRQRRMACDEAGWAVVGHEMSDLDRFLAMRPEVL